MRASIAPAKGRSSGISSNIHGKHASPVSMSGRASDENSRALSRSARSAAHATGRSSSPSA